MAFVVILHRSGHWNLLWLQAGLGSLAPKGSTGSSWLPVLYSLPSSTNFMGMLVGHDFYDIFRILKAEEIECQGKILFIHGLKAFTMKLLHGDHHYPQWVGQAPTTARAMANLHQVGIRLQSHTFVPMTINHKPSIKKRLLRLDKPVPTLLRWMSLASKPQLVVFQGSPLHRQIQLLQRGHIWTDAYSVHSPGCVWTEAYSTGFPGVRLISA